MKILTHEGLQYFYNQIAAKFSTKEQTAEAIEEAVGNAGVGTVTSVNGKTGVVELSASDVGALPASTQIPSIAGLATETYVDNKVAAMVDSAPETLNTLNELAAALGDDPNFATTVATEIGGKVSKSGDTMTGNLTIKKSTYPTIRLTEDDTNKALNLQFASGIFDVSAFNAGDSANNYRTLRLVDSEYRSNVAHALSILDVVNGTRNTYNIYHEGNKPTAADVGALPISGGTLTGSLTMGDDALFIAGHMHIGSNTGPYLYTGGTNFVVRYGDSSNYHYANFTAGGPIEIDGNAVSMSGHTHSDKVSKSGDTMTGQLTASGFSIKSDGWAMLRFYNAEGAETGGFYSNQGARQLSFFSKDKSGYSDYFKLPYPSGLTADGYYDILTSKNPVTIAQGGTGATDATTALKNLGAFGALGGAGNYGSDLNNFTQQGAILISGEVANRPEGTSVYGICWNVFGQAGSYIEQHYVNAATLKRYIRFKIDNVWRAWAQEYDSNFKPTPAEIGAAPASHTHHNLIAVHGNAGELFWHDDFLLSSATRTVPSLHFGMELLYRHDSSTSQYYSIYDTGNKPTAADVGALPTNPGSIEFLPGASSSHGGFIDFHYNGSTFDHTSRIIEDSENYLNINAFDGGKVKLGRVTAGTWQGSTIDIAYGGTGAATRADAANNLSRIGTSPIKSTTNDTVTKWTKLGNGVAWYGTSGQLIDQPNAYGTLLNLNAAHSEVAQLWFSAPSGAVYHRGANDGGWSGTWTKFYDTSNKPTPDEIGAATSSHTHSSITDGTASASIGISTTPLLSLRKGGYNHWSIERVGDSDNRLAWHYYDPSTGSWLGNAILIDSNGGTINGAVTINNTLTATKVIGAVYA